jgi:hypothetical protein
MTQAAKGTFTLNWDEKPPYDDEPGASIARVTVTKRFSGGIEGTGVAELIKAMTDVENSAGYVGIERIKCRLDGREGTFVLQHAALSSAKNGQSISLDVIPDSGTGELKGLAGSMDVHPAPGEHEYVLTYHFEK